jgi:hypothetical protein
MVILVKNNIKNEKRINTTPSNNFFEKIILIFPVIISFIRRIGRLNNIKAIIT